MRFASKLIMQVPTSKIRCLAYTKANNFKSIMSVHVACVNRAIKTSSINLGSRSFPSSEPSCLVLPLGFMSRGGMSPNGTANQRLRGNCVLPFHIRKIDTCAVYTTISNLLGFLLGSEFVGVCFDLVVIQNLSLYCPIHWCHILKKRNN